MMYRFLQAKLFVPDISLRKPDPSFLFCIMPLKTLFVNFLVDFRRISPYFQLFLMRFFILPPL